jgi:single-stranded-DNA-specific exonuclease
MSIASKHWLVAEKAAADHLRRYKGMSAVLAQVLYNRGYTDPHEAAKFLYVRDVEADLFKMKGMNGAVNLIRQTIKKQVPIVVYGDFDADGVTSTALMIQTLRALGAVVQPYIPDRVDEGYGLNNEALKNLKAQGIGLVLTVDCGIRSVDEVEYGKSLGLTMIVTDHHSKGPVIPAANAVLNPKQDDCPYPEKMLAGVGVAYKLAQGLLRATAQQDRRTKPALTEDSLLDLVALGTVADLAPLNRMENRALVRMGLERINAAERPGIRALLAVSGIEPGKATAMSIGYSLGPRINAAGRLGSAMTAYRLLMTDDPAEAEQLANELQALNEERQGLTREAQERIRARLEAEQRQGEPLIFAADREFRPGIVGLVAGRLVEEYYRPAVVMEQGDDESRASCRSIPQFDITQALDQCADLLVRHGGHAQAAGFTVRNENIDPLIDKLAALARQKLDGQDLKPTLYIDAEVDANQLSDALWEELQLLEPTGYMNPAPVFMMRNAYIVERRLVGKDNRHLKLKVQRAGRPPIDAIGFGLGDWLPHLSGLVDLAYQLDINEWNGRSMLQLNVQDIRLPEAVNGAS